MASYTDEAQVEELLKAAIAYTAKPALSADQFALLKSLASTEIETVPTWTSESLNRAASLGWQWKAGLVADKYEKIGGGPGIVLERPNWVSYCMSMATAYAPGGGATIDGTGGNRRSGIASVGLITSTSADYWDGAV